MRKVNLFWAIVWSVMAGLSVLAIFWNPSPFLMLAISALMVGMFWHDFRKTKGM